MTSHAVLSPSSSHRWLNCTPSARLELEFKSNNSSAAEEGTVAHAFCEHKLKKALKLRSNKPVSDYDSDEMQEATDTYVEYVLEQLEIARGMCNDPTIIIEQKVDFSEYVPDGFGTADCIIVSDEKLHIIDFKYGVGVLVDAYENPQMKCYALGALAIYDSLYDIKEISMTIFQPRRENISTYTISTSELKRWGNEVLKPKAELAIKGEGEYCVGDWCRFCKASVKCRKRAEDKLKLAKEEFKMPPLLTDEEIEEVLHIIPDLTKWANDVVSYATDSAVNHGKEWRGFKLVEGRSIRKFKDEDAVIKKARENGYTDIFKTSLISITEMQKLMGRTTFNELLGDLVIKPKGKPILVQETNKRKGMNISNINDEFNEAK